MSSRIDLADLTTKFITGGLYLRNWSARTARTYRQAFDSYARCRGDGGGGLPAKEDLEAWVVWLRRSGVSPGGVNMYLRTMNSFLSWAHAEGHSPNRLRVRLLPNPRRPLRGFSDAEVRGILALRPSGLVELRTWTLAALLFDTGVRIDEALTLSVDAVDLDGLLMRVRGKGNKHRVVPFSPELRKVLYRYHAKAGPRRFFLSSTSSDCPVMYRNAYRELKALCRKAGVEGAHVHPHNFRHCFAVTYVRQGGDVYRLSRILGHESVSTTQLYLRSMGVEQVAENHAALSPLSANPAQRRS